MSLFELFILAVGLSMDAFAISICKGFSINRLNLKKASTVGLYFGFFQGFMPVIGYFLGVNFQHQIEAYDHWIAFILLGLIGLNMIRESRNNEGSCEEEALDFKNMVVLSLATSIDALAVGISFAFLKINIGQAAGFIGVITFILSMIGVLIGHLFGVKYKSKAEITGGVILILMGFDILLSHLGYI